MSGAESAAAGRSSSSTSPATALRACSRREAVPALQFDFPGGVERFRDGVAQGYLATAAAGANASSGELSRPWQYVMPVGFGPRGVRHGDDPQRVLPATVRDRPARRRVDPDGQL